MQVWQEPLLGDWRKNFQSGRYLGEYIFCFTSFTYSCLFIILVLFILFTYRLGRNYNFSAQLCGFSFDSYFMSYHVYINPIWVCKAFWFNLAPHIFLKQFLLVDLRCHGESASIKKRGPHNVASAALDVLKLVRLLDH